MDVLGHMIVKAAEEGLLQPLAGRALQHQISLYADDVVLFLRPEATEIGITMDILCLFGVGSGLKTNLQKSSVLHIICGIIIEQLYNNFHVQLPITHVSIWAYHLP
jgi:hypothetical protein